MGRGCDNSGSGGEWGTPPEQCTERGDRGLAGAGEVGSDILCLLLPPSRSHMVATVICLPFLGSRDQRQVHECDLACLAERGRVT